MRRVLLAATAVAALAVAGCGSSSNTPSSSPPASTGAKTTATATSSTPAASAASTVSIAANPSGMLMFNTSSVSAKAGKVTIAFTNNAPVDHNLTLATASGAVLGSTPTFKGGTKMLTVTLKAGTYMFYCSVPGHQSGGMQGKLVIS